MTDQTGIDIEVRALASELFAKGHKVTLDYYVNSEAAAAVIRRQQKTLRNWRYNTCGPRWEKMDDGTVWYRLADLIEWRRKATVLSGHRDAYDLSIYDEDGNYGSS